MSSIQKSAFLALSLFYTACSPSTPSELQGHYEETDAEAMEAFAFAQRAIAEHEPSRGVVIGLPLISSMEKYGMVDALLSAVDKVWVTVEPGVPADFSGIDFQDLRTKLGSKMNRLEAIQHTTYGSVTLWSRDWAPQGAKTPEGDLRLLDFNYYPDRRTDDATARAMQPLLPEASRVSVPVYNEGGNFMNNSRGDCMMAARVTEANRSVFVAGDMVLNDDQIKEYYERFAGCKITHIFPRLPAEGTGHIDMWAKFLDDDTVLVNEIRNEVLTMSPDAPAMQEFLNARAKEITALGFKVVRVPMPVPYGRIIRSYSNSLIVNGQVLIPEYIATTSGMKYPDDAYLAAYEKEVAAVYEAIGYQVTWIPSDDLIALAGAVHCTTMQIPQ